MKTVVVFDDMRYRGIRFFVLEGDYTHFDGVYINDEDNPFPGSLLHDLLYDYRGNEIVSSTDTLPREEIVNGAKIIVAGFLP